MAKKTAVVKIEVGMAVFIRCLTYHYTGRVVAVDDRDIVITDAAWIADSGRFATAMATGALSEVEPYPDKVVDPKTKEERPFLVWVNRQNVVDCCEWMHPLPRSTK